MQNLKASELIAKLEELIKHHGDRTIYLEAGGWADNVVPDEDWWQGKDRRGLGVDFVITTEGEGR